ncbi:MAG: hypothetical protein ACYTXA_11985 [Nostoc sp.]
MTTPITDSLTSEQEALLTPKAKTLTEEQVMAMNKWVRSGETGKAPVEGLTLEDVRSLERAFDRNTFDPTALGTDACCCCTPASCCCAAAESKPIRSRRIL